MASIKPWDIDISLMMHPALNKIINLSTLHHEGLSKTDKRHRASLGSTALYHTVLNEQFKETRIVKMVKGKPQYPKAFYLSNIEIEYLPDHAVWKIIFSNGGKKRKNAKLHYKIMETIYVRRLQGVYMIDEEFPSSEVNPA